MDLQDHIDEIVSSKMSSADKVSRLKKLFIENDIRYFSDFDDTISDWTCIFYSKMKVLRWLGKSIDYNRLLEGFKFNKAFLSLSKGYIRDEKIVILSRNQHTFLKAFLRQFSADLKHEGIQLVWCVWRENTFGFVSSEKLWFLPIDAYFIWDNFESKKLRDYPLFINVSRFGFFRSKIILLLKLLLLFYFFARWC